MWSGAKPIVAIPTTVLWLLLAQANLFTGPPSYLGVFVLGPSRLSEPGRPFDRSLASGRMPRPQYKSPRPRETSWDMAYSAWMQDSELGSEAEKGLSQEERDAELRRAARMFLFSEFVKDREM